MERSKKIAQLRRNLATSDFRGLTQMEKGMKLIEDLNISARIAADILEINQTSFRRALRARADGRQIGRVGKPPIFNEEEEINFLEYLKSLPEDVRLTYTLIRQEVLRIPLK
jgi:hypothetical protein